MSIDCPQSVVDLSPGCPAANIEQVRMCFDMGVPASLTSNIILDASDCDGNAVLDISGTSDLGIFGNGFNITRLSGQANCSIIRGTNTQGFFLDNVEIGETPGPEVPALGTYAHMLHFINSSDICIRDSEIFHSWGYAVYNNGVEGFKFEDNLLRDSGALGLYIGHTLGNPTNNAVVTGNDFISNSTNAVAVLGGTNVLIDDNLFVDNHTIGVFPVAPQFGTGFTGGGQVYLAEGDAITFTNNEIRDGFCTNCVTAGILQNPVTGLEVGLPNQASITNTLIENNSITNNSAFGLRLNSGSILDAATQARNNLITGNFNDVSFPAANFTA